MIRRIANWLLGRSNDLVESSGQQQDTDHIKANTEWYSVTWMACDDSSARCVDGGVHQPCLQGVVDPLANADEKHSEAKQQGLGIGDSLDLNGQTHDCSRCTKCNKDVVPVLYLKPGVRFFYHGMYFFDDGRILAQGGAA